MATITKKKMFKRRRALLTIGAVAISMALLVSMLSVAQGIEDFSYEEITNSREDVVLSSVDRHDVTHGHTLSNEIAQWDQVVETLPRLTDILSINVSGKKRSALAEGVVPDNAWAFLNKDLKKDFDGWFEIGSDPHFDNDYSGPFTNEVLISSSLADDLSLSKGDGIGVSKSSNGIEHPFIVKGIFKTDFAGGGVFDGYYFISMHLSEMQSILDIDKMANETVDIVDSVSFYLEPQVRTNGKRVKEFIDKVEEVYPVYRGALFSKEDRLSDIEGFVNLANGFNLGIGIVAVMIGILFVACVMIISVYERTHLIGLMRALGISKRTIFLSTFKESLAIVTLGSLIGLVPGFLISNTLGDYLGVSYGLDISLTTFSLDIMLRAITLTLVIGTVTSFFPAWLATRMNVIHALKYIR